MNHIVENPEGGQFLSELQQKPPSEKDARLFRQGMRSLLLVGNFGDLSVAGQVHPGVQKRLQYSAPEMDAAVSGTTDHMKSLSQQRVLIYNRYCVKILHWEIVCLRR